MSKTALFVGAPEARYRFSGYQHAFAHVGFEIIEATTFDEFVRILETRGTSVVIFYAYKDSFSKPLDLYKGKLPPIIYWCELPFDSVPENQAVHCVDWSILPSQMVKIALEMLHLWPTNKL